MQRTIHYRLLISICLPDGVERLAPNYVSTAADGKQIGLTGFRGILFGRKEIDGKVRFRGINRLKHGYFPPCGKLRSGK